MKQGSDLIVVVDMREMENLIFGGFMRIFGLFQPLFVPTLTKKKKKEREKNLSLSRRLRRD